MTGSAYYHFVLQFPQWSLFLTPQILAVFKVSSDFIQLNGIIPAYSENSKQAHPGPPNTGPGSCLCSLPELCGRDVMPWPLPCWSCLVLTFQLDLGLVLSLQTCLVITGMWMTLVLVTKPALLFLPRHSRTVSLVCEVTAHLTIPLAISSHFPAEQLTPAAPPTIALWVLILRTSCTCYNLEAKLLGVVGFH